MRTAELYGSYELIELKNVENRRATTEEMAKAMLFLASSDSSYCLGSELLVDGGLSELVNPDL